MVEKLKFFIEMNIEPVDPTYYCCLVGKLIHLTHTNANISFVLGVVGSYVLQP